MTKALPLIIMDVPEKILTERQAFLALNALPHIGPVSIRRLLDSLGGDPRAVFAAGVRRLEEVRGIGPAASSSIANWRAHFDLAREEERMAAGGVSFVTMQDDIYPKPLRELHDRPAGLYRKGRYDFGRPAIAMVGTRRTTLYGQAVAKKFAAELARLGFCVVSGLARGIDTAAHEGALSTGGKTVAVLGCGIDIVYPPENLELYRRVMETGAVVSEFPFGRRADRQTFAMRNRIIAGMCEAVIVVESDVNGGSMITARFAGEQGRHVFAVPGRIDQATSRGCHQLIRDGATLLTSVDDILDELSYLEGLRPKPIPPKAGDAAGAAAAGVDAAGLSGPEAAVMACFAGGAMPTPDAIAAQTGRKAAEISATLMMLELKRHIAKRADGSFEARGEG
ncbi:MAG: DNA-processing protein DprA [Opitutaceae bacterium]|nr:DNA-processing protein DprA [Opitutaceae bacterium]